MTEKGGTLSNDRTDVSHPSARRGEALLTPLRRRQLSTKAGGDENLWIAFRTQYKEETRRCIVPQGCPGCRSAANKHTLLVESNCSRAANELGPG